ncbi:hypothetical protein V5F38_13345 [Xanthobacter sp. V0B-10]|uniref:hypothetical protein n=1 Tax=Xanthobacter albus TaxID=3119929 RepID=UPI00372990D5
MPTRRRVLAAAVCLVALPRPLRAAWPETELAWFTATVSLAPPTLDECYYYLLRQRRYRFLVDARARLEEVRRNLEDPGAKRPLRSRLQVWLARHDALLMLAPRPDEDEEDFNRRRERKWETLAHEWERCRDGVVAALKRIDALGADLQDIVPDAMASDEWSVYRRFMAGEQEIAEFLEAGMPTEPPELHRLKSSGRQLAAVIVQIEANRAALDAAIRQAA